MWSGERLAKIHATTVPEKCWPEVWSKMGKTAQKKEKQEWANEKPKLDDARRLRGIYFIDPEDGEYKETIQNARTKLEVRMEAAMRCRRGTKMHSGLQELKRRVMKTTRFQKQSMRALWKFTNQESVWNHLHKKVMKITSKAKGTLRSHSKFGTQIYSDASSDDNSGCESSSGKGMGRSSKRFQPGSWTKQRVKERLFSKQKKREKESPFCYIDGHLSSQNCEVRAKISEV